jgi:hypothetical protein
MKNIKDLTEQDCIHCGTQEEFNAVLAVHNPKNLKLWNLDAPLNTLVLLTSGSLMSLDSAIALGYTIHPSSDFLTPTVNVLTEIGDTKVIKNGGDVIVMTGNVVITLTPPVLKHIQELLNQQQ